MTTSSSPCRARSTSALSTNGSAIRSVAPAAVRLTVTGPSTSAGASGSSSAYAALANASSGATPTGYPAWYADRQIGSPAKDSSTTVITSVCACTQPALQSSASSAGNIRLAITPSTV